MARTQFKVTFTNAQPGAPVSILTPSVEHVYSSAAATKPVGGKQLYLDATNAITVWSDAQDVIAQTVDGAGLFIQGTATVASPTVTVGDGTAPTNPAGSAASGVPVGGTTGQVLKKNSNTDSDTGWGDTAQLSNATPLISSGAGTPGTGIAASRNDHVHPAPAGLAAGLPINYYVAVATAKNSSTAFTLNTEYCWAFILPGAGTIDSLAIECAVLGDAGSVLRWGVRQDNAGLPSATVAAQGTVAATTTGYKTVTGLSIPYGATNSGILWLSLAWQGGTATSPQVEACEKGGGSFFAGPLAGYGTTPGGAQGHIINCATTTGITGAFTTAVPVNPGTTQWGGDVPHIWLRRSA